MKKTIGILAHVDAGKTTFSEQVLYHVHSIQRPGRVDHQNAFLDSHPIERERGITVFADQAFFTYGDNQYYLVDTPGHVDFSAEMERAIQVLDYAIILVSCVEGVQSHTETVWQLTRRYGIPTFFFLNKVDRAGADPQRTLKEIAEKLTPDVVDFSRWGEEDAPAVEELAQRADVLLTHYLDEGFDASLWQKIAVEEIRAGHIFPCFSGSALLDEGVEAFWKAFDCLTVTDYHLCTQAPLAGRVYKVRHDAAGNRLTYVKILAGFVSVKDEVTCTLHGRVGQTRAKVHELRMCHGSKLTHIAQAQAGELCVLLGMSGVAPGDGIGTVIDALPYAMVPMLSARVQFGEDVPLKRVLEVFRILEDEDPMLTVQWDESLQEIQVQIMGSIQLEVLQEVALSRYGLPITFGDCHVLYKETLTAPVRGCGHYEPLRHYAEVHLQMEPLPLGSGIQFASACALDDLDSNYQNLVRTHVLEREHKGVLIGAPLTDVKITLVMGLAHLKHTEGGDFREATYRAVRQGLMSAQSLLLEPMMRFVIHVSSDAMGRVLTEIPRMHGSFDTPDMDADRVTITGCAPVACMMNYSRELAAFTRGKGVMTSRFAGYAPCHNAEEVIAQRRYQPTADPEHTPDSMFCSHGAGFAVAWDRAPDFMHYKG